MEDTEQGTERRHAPLPDGVIDVETANVLAERLKMLSDPSRLRMIYALAEVDELCVGDLAATVGSSESATSHQLRQMRLGGLVRARKQGREVFYRIADTHVRQLLEVIAEHFLHGDPEH